MPSKSTILLTGGTGKISSRIAPLLSKAGYRVLIASRSGTTPSDPNCQGCKFDWLDSKTYDAQFDHGPVSAIFLVTPPIMEPFPSMKAFIDLAIQKGIKRFVLLGASIMESGDGPMMAQVAQYLMKVGVEYAILRPTWFMENFSEMHHVSTIRDQDSIVTAAGDGKVPFVSAEDIAAVAFKALTNEVAYNAELLILGSELYSYDDVAALLTKKLGRKITHVKITEEQMATGMSAFMPREYADLLAQLDTAIANGAENRTNDVVEKVTGKKPILFEDYVDGIVAKGIWAKK